MTTRQDRCLGRRPHHRARLAAALAGFALLPCAARPQAPPAQARPNIVVFLSDDHGFLDSPVYGATDARTPSMQRLAAEGMTFTHAFVASPSCAPSRAALLTGLMPARNGAEANHTYKREGVRSLTEDLKRLGFQVAAFGKVAHGADGPRHGFDVLDKRYDIGTLSEFLDRRDATVPLALFVGTNEPHVPWAERPAYDPSAVALPPTFVDTPQTREQRARYLTDVTQMDTELGDVFDLARRRLGRDLLFVYTSDNGGQWPFGKWNLYDAGIRTPLVVAWPGVVTAASRSDAMLSWVDILPTLIAAAGGSPPADIDGRSFLGVLRRTKARHREEVFATHSGDANKNVYPIRAVRTRRFKLILNLFPQYAHTTHTDRGGGSGQGRRYYVEWVAAAKSNEAAAQIVRRYHQRPAVELYDVLADPFETRNLADDPHHRGVVADLRRQLEEWMKAQGDTRRLFDAPIPIGAGGMPAEP
jgi:N-sulfoglucosamine sulfohydrolase